MAQHVTNPAGCLVQDCTKSWPCDPVYLVSCPQCNAGVGTPCLEPSGQAAWHSHAERARYTAEQGSYLPCPTGHCDRPGRPSPPLVEYIDNLREELAFLRAKTRR